MNATERSIAYVSEAIKRAKTKGDVKDILDYLHDWQCLERARYVLPQDLDVELNGYREIVVTFPTGDGYESLIVDCEGDIEEFESMLKDDVIEMFAGIAYGI